MSDPFELWPSDDVERRHDSLTGRTAADGLSFLRDALLARLHLAAHYGISRQRFARRFHDATGMSPKHMINEFRGFAGSPPTLFFQPPDGAIARSRIQLRGRPSEWLRA
jgi:hypothetical protein